MKKTLPVLLILVAALLPAVALGEEESKGKSITSWNPDFIPEPMVQRRLCNTKGTELHIVRIFTTEDFMTSNTFHLGYTFRLSDNADVSSESGVSTGDSACKENLLPTVLRYFKTYLKWETLAQQEKPPMLRKLLGKIDDEEVIFEWNGQKARLDWTGQNYSTEAIKLFVELLGKDEARLKALLVELKAELAIGEAQREKALELFR